MIDFYGDRKLAYYSTKRDSAPLAIGIARSTPELKAMRDPPPQILGPPHDLSDKKYIFDVWGVNTTLSDEKVSVEVRLFDIVTGKMKQEKRLESQDLGANRTTEFLEDLDVDEQTAVQAIMYRAGEGQDKGAIIGRASDWPQPLKYVTLPSAYNIKVSVLDGGRVEVSSSLPVKGVELYVDNDERNIVWSDNGFDIFPGDVYVVEATGLGQGDDIRARYYGSDWISNHKGVNGTK